MGPWDTAYAEIAEKLIEQLVTDAGAASRP